MDEGDPQTEAKVRKVLEEMTSEAGIEFHGLRHRNAGSTVWVEFHLLFPRTALLESAHALATRIEERIERELPVKAEVTSHLETLEDHRVVHTRAHHEDFSD